MEIIKAGLKQTVEQCKRVARDHGLQFGDETLEFVITNEDMIRLSPKGMIPSLYDYWVHDVFVLQDKGKYELYPHNPYETVINTRPPISFYNDNNPDWLNVMIFYHVIGHIDFFQNNVFFSRTWSDDFLGRAQAHANLIAELRHEHGRWVDYVIEFARGIDNLVDYFGDLAHRDPPVYDTAAESQFAYFFDHYLQEELKVTTFQYLEELRRYNELAATHDPPTAKTLFMLQAGQRHLDFHLKYERRQRQRQTRPTDVLEYIMRHSSRLEKDENHWMRSVMTVVRDTSLYFQPQIRTKILNEGWASYWHEILFMADPCMRTHEFEWSKVNAGVVSLSRVGLNPYAIGLRLFKYLEAKADRGMLGYEFEKVGDIEARKSWNRKTGRGRDFIFEVRRFFADHTAISEFIDQDFVNEFNLFVVGKRINRDKTAWEYYIKSRKARDYRQKLLDSLYHPPVITVDDERTRKDSVLTLKHTFEGKELVREYIEHTMLGIEFLWGGKVVLETHEIDTSKLGSGQSFDLEQYDPDQPPPEFKWQKIRYTMHERKLQREVLDAAKDDRDDPYEFD